MEEKEAKFLITMFDQIDKRFINLWQGIEILHDMIGVIAEANGLHLPELPEDKSEVNIEEIKKWLKE
jgi:hypothetical protein